MLHTASGTRKERGRGRLLPHLRAGAQVAGPWAHAYLEGQIHTLCAIPLDLLDWRHLVHLDFTDVPEPERCELCALLADRS